MAIVRYVSSSSGANVRNAPAGNNVIVTMTHGELMYDIIGVSRVTASLNGV